MKNYIATIRKVLLATKLKGMNMFDCSDIDDIIAFKSDGTVVVGKVQEKDFFGTDIIHVDVFTKKNMKEQFII